MSFAISISELADGAAHEPLLDADGRVRDPAVLVDLAGRPDPGTVDRAVRRAGCCDRLLIGVGERSDGSLAGLVESLDLSVLGGGLPSVSRACVPVADPYAYAAVLGAKAQAVPQAALTLGRLLRLGAGLPVPTALEFESYAYSTLLGGGEFAAWLAARGASPQPPEVADPVLAERAGETLTITLNRPGRRNAYGRGLRDALVAALEVAVRDDGLREVLLRGAGPVFCSGGDLAEFGTCPDLMTAHLIRTTAGAARLIHALGKRLEVWVHGACVGAGVELPALASRVVADPEATFRLPELEMGLIPGAGGTVGLPRRIGRWRTLDLVLSGVAVDARTALAWGLVDELRRQ